jgi:hypothetical protein
VEPIETDGRDCARCRKTPEAPCPCKAPLDPEYPGEIGYDPEANGWEDGCEEMRKLVRGHLFEIWWNHHGAGYSVDGSIVSYDLSSAVEGTRYRATTAALAWEIDNGIGAGDIPPGRRVVAVIAQGELIVPMICPVFWVDGDRVHRSDGISREPPHGETVALSGKSGKLDLDTVRAEVAAGRAFAIDVVLREAPPGDMVAVVFPVSRSGAEIPKVPPGSGPTTWNDDYTRMTWITSLAQANRHLSGPESMASHSDGERFLAWARALGLVRKCSSCSQVLTMDKYDAHLGESCTKVALRNAWTTT